MRLGLSEKSILKHKNILAIPSIHSRVYFAEMVRIAFKVFKPTVIAVEQPEVFTESLREAVSRLPYVSMIIREYEEEEATAIPIDPCDSIVEAVRMAIAFEIPFVCIDKDIESNTNNPYIMPDDYLLTKMSFEEYYKEIIARYKFNSNEKDKTREKFMAGRLASLSEKFERVLYVGGMSHWEEIKRLLTLKTLPQAEIEREGQIQIYNVAKTSLINVLGEMPFITHVYWLHRTGKEEDFDRADLISRIFFEAMLNYKLPIPKGIKKAMLKYLRNLALLERKITPDYIDILTAAKDFAGNDFALDVYDTIKYYPHYTEEDKRYKTIEIEKDPYTNKLEGLLKEKKIRLRKREGISEKIKVSPVKTRPNENYEGEWEEIWRNSSSQLSHVPEDILMENYMNSIRTRALRSLGEDKTKIEEFSVSFKDGIDLRATLREYLNGKIYVKSTPKVRGNVGPVVMIFDEENKHDYPWRISWLSEAHDDSDLVVYATEPGCEIVGPGISRCYFGGYTSIVPPQIKMEMWSLYPMLLREEMAHSYADLLLYSAIIYCKERYLVYCAPTPPYERLKTFAAEKHIQIIYFPLTAFSTETLTKLRNFHVLGSKRLRSIAHKYIF